MKILIVEDHPLLQESLEALVREHIAGAQIETAGSLGQALASAGGGARPYLVILDLGLPDSTGLATLARFHKAYPDSRVAVLADSQDGALAHAAVAGGASGFLPKTHQRPMLVAALQLVVAGGIYMPVNGHAPVERTAGAARIDDELTERQIDVLRLIARGLRNREIGERLRITEDTVKQHARLAYAALGVSSRTEAMTAIARRGIAL